VVRYNERGSRFNPDRLTTVYGFVRAGLDLVLWALTSYARFTIAECTKGVGRHAIRAGMLRPGAVVAARAGLVCDARVWESSISADLNIYPLSPTTQRRD